MFSRCLFQWNAVDVVGCDGLLHRGLVVGKSKARLSIDFGIPKKESTLIYYDRVFRDPGQNFMKREPLEHDVELLYQLSPDQPWKWFPAQLLSASTDSFLLVDMQTEGAHVRAVFRQDRVRRRSHYRVNVRRNDFIKDDVPVPAGFLATEDFCQRWKEWFPNTHPVGVEGGRFLYIQSRNYREIPLEYSLALVNMTESELAVLPRGTKRRLGDFLAEETMATVENSSLIIQLPLEVLAEVFTHIEILDQTILRRVCARFALAVSSRACKVAIVYPSRDGFIFASSLFTMLSKRPTYIIFDKDQESVDDDIILLQRMVDAAGIKVSQLILVDVAVNAKNLVDYTNFALLPAFRSICSRLILKNVAVYEALGTYVPYGRYDFKDVHIGYCTVYTDDESDFRQIFEQHCSTPKEQDLRRLGEWINGLNRESGRTRQEAVITILKQWQYDDPRFGPHCTWEDVKRAGLEKKIDTLRKTTLLALLSRKDNFGEISFIGLSDDSSMD